MTPAVEKQKFQAISQRDSGKSVVLVVDNHKEVLRFIEIDLEIRGFEVITSTSGEEALRLVDSARPNIMLLDIMIPGMGGFEVLRQLRDYSQLPVIAFSVSEDNQREALRVGATDFVKKPFYPDELADKIKCILD